MEPKDLLPLVGVLLGWALKEFSDHFRGRAAARAEIGVALKGLLMLEAELNRLDTLLKMHKNRPIPWSEYEAIRQDTSARYLSRSDPRTLVGDAVTTLAKSDPTEAAALHDVVEMIALAHKTRLQPPEKDDKGYIWWLSSLETSIEIGEMLLRKLTLRLAWLHSPLTWLRLKWQWRKRRSKLARQNREFTEAQIHALYAKISKSRSGDESSNPEQRSEVE